MRIDTSSSRSSARQGEPRQSSPQVAALLPGIVALAGLALGACSSAPFDAVACTDLMALEGPNTTILTAEEIAAADGIPAHCKVTGLIETEINFELLLPEEWNGKFLMGGGGGFVGSVENQAQQGMSTGPKPLERGYATVGTDTGHSGANIDARWALDNPRREENFAHRAVHLTAETSKSIIRDHYGDEIAYSYFMGCSRGGGQALIEAQRYPTDFDGIVAGAPAQDWPGIGAGMIQTQQAIYPDPGNLSTPVITADNRSLLEAELLGACDQIDGLADGIIDDPRNCPFSPDDLPRCTGDGPGADCLTEAQLAAINSIYDGPMVDGERVFPGFTFGGENDQGGWAAWITGGQSAIGAGIPSLHYAFGTQMYKFLVFDDPEWDYSTYDFSDWEQDTEAARILLNATDPDLSAFRDNGGKLLLFHGWSDPAIPALGVIDYYESVEAGDADVRDYSRLFMMPGVLHCAGGPGPSRVDYLTAVEDWVEQGRAPDSLLATRPSADPDSRRTRPLCPYPLVARYDATGNPDDASSFACAIPDGS